MTEKTIGYILLAAGILIALFSALNVYSVFTRKSNSISLFTLSGVGVDFTSILPPEIRSQARGQSAKTEIIPARDLNFSLNLFAHIILMGFVLNLGIKLAGLGIQLLRPIEIRLKEKSS